MNANDPNLDDDSYIAEAFLGKFAELVPNPVDDLLAEVTPQQVLALLQQRPKPQWMSLLQELRAPAQTLNVPAATRALQLLRRARPAVKDRAIRKLFVRLGRECDVFSHPDHGPNTAEIGDRLSAESGLRKFADMAEAWGAAPTALGVYLFKAGSDAGVLACLLSHRDGLPASWPLDDPDLTFLRERMLAVVEDAEFEPEECENCGSPAHSSDDHPGDEAASSEDIDADLEGARGDGPGRGDGLDTTSASTDETGPAPTPPADAPEGASEKAASIRLPYGLVFVPAAADPVGMAERASALRDGAADGDPGGASRAEAGLYERLAEIGAAAADLSDLASRAVDAAASAGDGGTVTGVPDSERVVFETLLAAPGGTELRDALVRVSEHARAGRIPEAHAELFNVRTERLDVAAAIPATMNEAMFGALQFQPAARTVDPVAAFVAAWSPQEPPAPPESADAAPAPADEPPDTSAEDLDEDGTSEEAAAEPDLDSNAASSGTVLLDPANHALAVEPARSAATAAEPQPAADITPEQDSGSEPDAPPVPEDATPQPDAAPHLEAEPRVTEPVPPPAPVAQAAPSAKTAAGPVKEPEPVERREPAEEQQAEVPAPASRLAGSDDEIDDARNQLIAARAWGALSELDGRLDEPTVAWEIAALAEAIRSPYGGLQTAVLDRVGQLNPRTVRQQPAQLVGLAATIRIPYVSPHKNAATAIRALSTVLAGDFPALARLADAACDADGKNFTYLNEAVATAGAAAVERELERLADVAAERLKHRTLTAYARSARIWETWTQDGGELHQMLAPIAGRDRNAVEQVRERHGRLNRRADVSKFISDADRNSVSTNRNYLEGSAKTTLQRAVEDAVAVAGEWLNVVDSSSAAAKPAHNRQAETLRTSFSAAIGAARDELSELAASTDAALAAAATASLAILEPVEALVRDGVPLTGSEAPRSIALRGDLLTTGLPLNRNLAVDEHRIAVGELTRNIGRSLADAFERRLAARQYGLAAVIAAELGRRGEDVEGLQSRISRALNQERSDLAGHLDATRSKLTAALRFGRIDSRHAEELSAELDETADAARDDIDRILEELDTIDRKVDTAAVDAAARFAAAIEQVSHTHPEQVDAIRSRVDALLAAEMPDLATAEDLLQRAVDGEDLADSRRSEPVRLTPAFVAKCDAGVTDELIASVWPPNSGPITFALTSESAANERAGMLRNWQSNAARKTAPPLWSRELAGVLRLLGLSGGHSTTRPEADRNVVRFDLIDAVRNGKALVPQFGSMTMGTYAFLLVWGQPSVDTLLRWVKDDPRESHATIVLHFGTMSMERRYELASRLRHRSQSKFRPLIVVDDAVMIHLARLDDPKFDDLMRATLPFSTVNPYFVGGGDVPVEMFYGRIQERTDIMENLDRTLIYGGRRLGKSALLRSAKAQFEQIENRKAVLVTLDEAGIGQSRRSAAVWDLLVPALERAGVMRPQRKQRDLAVAGSKGIQEWLDGDPARRLLVLLDEADDFFNADAEAGFEHTRRFKSLKEDSRGRFKPVFAGLHQVARFAHHHNQPFAQLVSEEQPIGPLPPIPARDLLERPLDALGWRFAADELVDRALHACNYIPILIQEFGKELVNRLRGRDIEPGGPPTLITAGDVEAVLHTQRFVNQARRRIEVTLELDHRYKVIAWVVRLRLVDQPTTGALYDECRALWPDGFAGTSYTEFRALVDELVQLGILASHPATGTAPRTWRIRSQNVGSWLGNDSDVDRYLFDLIENNPPVGSFHGATGRRELRVDGTARLASLNEGQLFDVTGRGRTQVRVVVGSEATGVGLVAAVMDAVGANLPGVRVERVGRGGRLRAALRKAVDGHLVIVDDLAGNNVGRDNVRSAVEEATNAPPPSTGTRSTILIVSPAQYLQVVDRVAAAPAGVDLEVLSCLRYTADGLREFTLADRGFGVSTERQSVLDATGGWPMLVEWVADETPRRGLTQALADVADVAAAELPEAAGVTGVVFRETLRFVSNLVQGSDKAAPADVLAEFVGDVFADRGLLDDPAAVLDALRLSGALAETGGLLYPEPLLARLVSELPDELDSSEDD